MCSVRGCNSPRRTPRFRLPADPEIRLEWVQFLAAVNQQCFKESSWTDFTVCCEHFNQDCLLYVAPHGKIQLTPGAVPSVFAQRQPKPAVLSEAGSLATASRQTDPTAPHILFNEWESITEIEAGNSSEEAAQDSDDDDWDPEQHAPSQKLHEQDEDDEEDDSEDDEERFAYSAYTSHCKLCTECGKFFRNRWPHTCEHKRRPFSCNICGKRCVNEVALLNHNRVHTDGYVHRCKYCNRTFKVKVEKLNHEQIHITDGKPYRCPECPQTFATNKERRTHVKNHRRPEDLKCHICGIQFLWALSVQRHMAVHTGLRPYKCSVCERTFNQAGHLKSHMRLHTGERPYKCQHCDMCFNHNVSLKSHVQRYHTSGSGLEKTKGKRKRGADQTWDNSEVDNAEEEQDTEEEGQVGVFKKKRRSTGRPKGRPKSYTSGDVVVAIKYSKMKDRKRKTQKRKRTKRRDEDSDEEPTYSDFDWTEEGGEMRDVERDIGNYDDDDDSDFDPRKGI